MKILVVAPWVPTSRRPRSYQFISMLAESHEVMVLAAAWSDEEAAEAQELPCAVSVIRLNRLAAVLRVLIAVVTGKCLQQAYVDAPSLRSRLVEEEREFAPDLMFFNVLRSAHLVRHVAGSRARRVLDLDEFRSAYYAQVKARGATAAARLVGAVESRRMRRAEGRAVVDFDVCLVSSPKDIDPSRPDVRLVRSAHLLGDVPQGPVAQSSRDVLFVGRMSYAANEQALLWFVEEVWPTVRERHGDARLLVVGEAPSSKVQALAGEDIVVTGRVEAIDPFYETAALAIVPIRMATGVQMKLIEGLASRTPTVATPLVADLAGVQDGVECLVADGPGEWVIAIDRILGEVGLAESLSRNGVEWLDQTHGYDAVREALEGAALTTMVPVR